MEQEITLIINGEEITFIVTLEDYNRYVNSLSADNKVSPSHNFCMSVVSNESRPALQQIINNPGFAIQIGQKVVDEYQPELNMMVKKPNSAAQLSKAVD